MKFVVEITSMVEGRPVGSVSTAGRRTPFGGWLELMQVLGTAAGDAASSPEPTSRNG